MSTQDLILVLILIHLVETLFGTVTVSGYPCSVESDDSTEITISTGAVILLFVSDKLD